MRANALLGWSEPVRGLAAWLRRHGAPLAAASLVIVATAGAARAQPSVPVKVAPPERKVEIQPPRPSESHSWIPGHWRWIGGTWVWTMGKWREPPVPGTYWQPGYWELRPYGYVWVPGAWVAPSP